LFFLLFRHHHDEAPSRDKLRIFHAHNATPSTLPHSLVVKVYCREKDVGCGGSLLYPSKDPAEKLKNTVLCRGGQWGSQETAQKEE